MTDPRLAAARRQASGGAIDGRLDHLVVVVPDLESATARMETRLGVAFTPGGSHEGLGTRNTLLSLGPRAYLELLGPDPAQPPPGAGLWLGAGGRRRASLAAWCVRSNDLTALASGPAGHLVGPVRSMSRATPAGDRLAWTLTLPLTPPPHGGLAPFFIDWTGARHPCDALADHGVRLTALRGRHPAPDKVRADLAALGVRLDVEEGQAIGLAAELACPNGKVVID